MNTKVVVLQHVLCILLFDLCISLLIGVKHSQQLPQPFILPWQPLQLSSPQPSWPLAVSPAPPSSHGRVSQHQVVTLSGHCVHGSPRANSHECPSKSQDAECDQQESHTTTVTSLSTQIEKGFHFTQGGRVDSSWKR